MASPEPTPAALLSNLRRRVGAGAGMLVAGVARSRPSWPAWLSRSFDALVARVPEGVALRVNPAKYGFSPGEVPSPPAAPRAAVRLYIAPVNSAGQGYLWARAAERLPGVAAVNMYYTRRGGYGFPADNPVPLAVFSNSRAWQDRQFEAVAAGFTHVIVESGRSVFGGKFDLSPLREVEELRARGVRVGMLAHGSDLRLPSRHCGLDEWSPFHDPAWSDVPALEEGALRFRALLERSGAPVFVSTPDLLLDWPAARWLPVVVDPARWQAHGEPLRRDRPVVLHAPTHAVIKGSDLIEPALLRMHEEGVIDYRRVAGIPAAQMPALYAAADIVLEQFRIGTYSVTAVEAMAAGRVVVAHVHDQVRAHVHRAHGLHVPVVNATIDSLETVLREVIERPEHFRGVAAGGPGYVRAVHDGTASAEVLRDFLGLGA